MLKLPGSETLGELDTWGRASPLGFARMFANPAKIPATSTALPENAGNAAFQCRRRRRKLMASLQRSVAIDCALGSEPIATGRARYFFCCSSTS